MTVSPEFSVISSLRPALYFAGSAAAVTLLLTASRNAALLLAAAAALATLAVWPHRGSQPIHAAVLIALLTNPIAAIVPTLLFKPDAHPYPPLIHQQLHANSTADIFGHAGLVFVGLFPIIYHYWLTTPAPPPRL